jgi:hypothetical protein
MKDAGWLVGVPIRVDVRAVLEQKVRDVKVTIDDAPGERGVEHLLHTDLIPWRYWLVAGA